MFSQTLFQVLTLFLFMVVGFILSKAGIFPKETPKVLSVFLVWVSCPALYLRTFASQFTPEKLPSSLKIMLVSAVCLAIIFALSCALGRLIIKDKYTRSVFEYSLSVPNAAYFGNPLVLAVMGESMLLQFQIFSIPMILFMLTVGYSLLIEKEINLKSILNPMMVATIVGIILGMLRIQLPDFIMSALSGASDCLGPVSMILTGCVISQFSFRQILSPKEVYITVFIKMLLMPLMVIAVGALFPIPREIYIITLLFNCMPVGLNSVVYPSSVGKDCSLGAGLAIVSNIAAVLTVPLFFYAASLY